MGAAVDHPRDLFFSSYISSTLISRADPRLSMQIVMVLDNGAPASHCYAFSLPNSKPHILTSYDYSINS